MKIELSNRQKKRRVNATTLKALTRWLMKRVQPLDPRKSWRELSLVLTDDAGITPLNAAAFGRNAPTDVISFAYRLPGPGGPDRGEVIVNVERAAGIAPGRVALARELAWYVAHGCHHLAGVSDATAARRRQMHRREKRWIAEAARLGLLNLLR